MPCDRLSLLKRLAVESPAQLLTPPWREHMEGCGECRMEKQVLDGTLAVFKQIESEGREQKEYGPSWEEFSLAVDQSETLQPIHTHPASMASSMAFAGQMAQILPQAQKPPQQKPRQAGRWRMMVSLASAASVATVAATVVGVMFWPVDPLPEAPRNETSSAAPAADHTAGKTKTFRTGGGFPAPPAPPPTQTVGRPSPTLLPVFRGLHDPAPTFRINRWRGGSGRHPAPVILFRSLQNRKSMGMDRPPLEKMTRGVSTRTSAWPAARPIKRPAASRSTKTARARSNKHPVATRSRAKGSPRRLGGGAVKSQLEVKPISSIPAAPFSPGASGGPQAPRPKAEAGAFTENRPAAEPSLKYLLATPDEKLKLQARMEAEEMAKEDAETKLAEADEFPEDPESQNDANGEDSPQATGVAP